MIPPDTVTATDIDHHPTSLEEGLEELKAIADYTRVSPKLDQLPVLVKRTLFLKAHIEAGILAIEHDIQGLTDASHTGEEPRDTTA